MTVFWIVLGVALVGGLLLAWRYDRKNRARRASLQGQSAASMAHARGNPNVAPNAPGSQPGGMMTP